MVARTGEATGPTGPTSAIEFASGVISVALIVTPTFLTSVLVSRSSAARRSDLHLESGNPAQVDARDVADRHEHEEQLATPAAARNPPWAAHVDNRFGDDRRHAAGRAHVHRCGEVDAEDLEKVASDRVAVERDHPTTNPTSST